MTLRELAEALHAELVGAVGAEEVLGVAGLGQVRPGHVTYVDDERRLAAAEGSAALAVIVGPGLRESTKPLLCAPNPRLAFARALALLHPAPRLTPGVHPTAQVGEGALLGEQVAVGAHAIIGERASIGRATQVHPLVSIGRDVVTGEDCVIFPNVTIYDGMRLGSRVVVHSGSVIGSAGFGYVWDGEKHVFVPHIGTVVIEDDVEIGANVTVDRGTTGATVIGRGTRIDNLVQVAHNVVIGRNCLLAGQVGISGSVTLEDGVVLGGKAGIADHVRMGVGSKGAAGAGVIRDVPPGQVVLGRPARPLAEQIRIDAAAPHLPDMVREIRRLIKRIEELERRLEESGR